MRILVYGFGPYKNFSKNITAAVIKKLPRQRGVFKVVFPVRFSRRQFVEAIDRFAPDAILGLGQSRRKRIEFETRALNKRRALGARLARSVIESGAKSLPTSLELKLGNSVNRSKNAGDYVCNFSMYVMLEYLARRNPSAKFGFLHIPYDCQLERASKVVLRGIEKIGDSSASPSQRNLRTR